MLKYVIVNLLPLAHTAFGRNAFLSISTADTSCETGRSSWGADDPVLVPWNVQWAVGPAGSWVSARQVSRQCHCWLSLLHLLPCFPSSLVYSLYCSCWLWSLPVCHSGPFFEIRSPGLLIVGLSSACTHGVTLACSDPWLLWPVHTEQVPCTFALHCSLGFTSGSFLGVVQSQSDLIWKRYFFIDGEYFRWIFFLQKVSVYIVCHF